MKNKNRIATIRTIVLFVTLFSLSIPGTFLRADQAKSASNPKTYNATLTDKGFSPRKLKIKSGDSVRWTNKSGLELQLAEGTHPKHTNCKYCPQGKKEGAYVSVNPGESYTFKFVGAGTANFHNHLMHNMTMTVVVDE